MEYNMIGNRLCMFGNNRVFCWRQDMMKIISHLNEDGYTVIDWNIIPQVIGLGFDFDCYIVLETVEDIEMRDAESERRANIRRVKFPYKIE